MSPHPKTIFMLAGEPSGDRLGADIMRALTSKFGKLRWCGMGGPDMQACGLNSSEDMSQLSIIGIGAALASIIRLNKLADRLIAQMLASGYIFTSIQKGFLCGLQRLRRYLANGISATYQHVVAPPSGHGGHGANVILRLLLMRCYACFRSSRTCLIQISWHLPIWDIR